MNVYVESNFVLELALLQEQSRSCEEILGLCETRGVQLVVPAYSLAEPYETLTRRQKKRKRLKQEIDAELGQIARTATYAERLDGFRDVTELLMNIDDEESKRLEEVCSRLTKTAEVIPLDASVLSASTQYQRIHDFAPQDALVYSAVLSHLERARAPRKGSLHARGESYVLRRLDGV